MGYQQQVRRASVRTPVPWPTRKEIQEMEKKKQQEEEARKKAEQELDEFLRRSDTDADNRNEKGRTA